MTVHMKCLSTVFITMSISSVQSLDRLVIRGTWQMIQQRSFSCVFCKSIVSSYGMGRDVHSLILSIQHFLCQPQHRPLSNMPWRMVLERLSWLETCPNDASFCFTTVARRDSCGPKRKLILLCTKSLVLCSKKEMWRSFLRSLVLKAWILSSVSKQGPCSTTTEENGGDKRLEEFELALRSWCSARSC